MGAEQPRQSMAELDEAHKCILKTDIYDDYEIVDDIGAGQYATVHRGVKINGDAHGVTDGTEVAIKEIDKGASGMTVTDKEIAVMMRIDNPHCVKLYAVYETETHVQMVLELMDGIDLFDRIIQKQDRPAPNKWYSEMEAKKLMKNVMLGVKHLHDKNIMHRDLKPENILLKTMDDDIDCKVGDFGLSRLFPEGGAREQKTGTLCGTPGYVAPEVLNRVPYSYGVDVWSLGVITYITVCGFPPFPLDMQAASVAKVKNADFSFPSPFWDKKSDNVKDLIKKMIVKDVDARFTLEQTLAHPWFADA